MSPSSLESGPIQASRRTGSTAALGGISAHLRRRAIAARAAVSGFSATALLVLVISTPQVPSPASADTSPVAALATAALDAIDVTTVLIAVAVLAAVALLRKLPYGIGVVIACTIGAVVTGELAREFAGASVSSTALPYGQLVATAALLGAASMVASTAWRPVVLGLGSAATLAVAAAALITGAASIVGIASALLVVFVWWPACSIVMLYSPDAAAREARNPLDTAALAVQRKMGRFR
ncbi:hypothetical protein CH294_17240 [Rhodococcus sp. 14-2483-1-1]|uniref:hypothetical protein n=1 Tax=unclassified Rhodococcus (in: high G+C Gram-positive bacteria) TaxID=192944 RepID=UPI000B9A1CAE|nr:MULTISPECIES: hypothetical protein [unclassified Rhodococcus (in: high G+C Gram-positive bacteria)]OZC93528.1 hypothetical protein CH254_01720 [Rhodococcus sp. 06-412-2C]OZD03703.1 hypothetical protein CH279_00645 [Rhodococcus sp. 06-412-2B]OZF33413.1 hypothetical protein CH294_17240 [Rhodococcus sp. 14-2483-1-1]